MFAERSRRSTEKSGVVCKRYVPYALTRRCRAIEADEFDSKPTLEWRWTASPTRNLLRWIARFPVLIWSWDHVANCIFRQERCMSDLVLSSIRLAEQASSFVDRDSRFKGIHRGLRRVWSASRCQNGCRQHAEGVRSSPKLFWLATRPGVNGGDIWNVVFSCHGVLAWGPWFTEQKMAVLLIVFSLQCLKSLYEIKSEKIQTDLMSLLNRLGSATEQVSHSIV